METKKHALLSASSSHKWLNHGPIALLEAMVPEEESSEAAEQGTAAHAMAEHFLKLKLNQASVLEDSIYHDEDMERYCQDYANFVVEHKESLGENTLLFIEQRLDFSPYVPEGFGTGDAVLISDKILHLIDFKYGRYYVNPENNTQLLLYALGALNLVDSIYDIEEVRMTIYQPRIGNVSTWTMDTGPILEWANGELKVKAMQAYKGEGNLEYGDWLGMTKIKAISKDRAKHHLELRKYQLREAHLLNDEEMAEVLSHVDDLVRWGKDVKEFAQKQAVENDKHYPGFKLVEGRSSRRYVNVKSVEQRAAEQGIQDIYQHSLLPLTKLESKLGKEKFHDIFGDLITKPLGEPTLVSESDGRPEIVKHDVNADFK
ncbi:DUF2800 domain-containing protein [Fundicoccus culcitae]|uniref:DUF2800 domain-containing protein n=1 Tax=Fundicoccus culcitae TaxID=2969821 RepID=A0ABY5P8H7_9LACT|nr:DUF2800 domain-containing protein [Fundicoccus culcitae]UUX34891.1 DUF2800 domain-containing protein [Fundicoccus culcitae]